MVDQHQQPDPIPNTSTPIVDLVVADLVERKAHGIREYGTPLQAGNGRDMLLDTYEELMDAAVYIRGAIEERSQAIVAQEVDSLDPGTVSVLIGNTDDRLSQRRWSQFVAEVTDLVDNATTTVHFSGLSSPSAPFQNACWTFTASKEYAPSWFDEDGTRAYLRDRLRQIAKEYGQDSVAWVEGKTEFLYAADQSETSETSFQPQVRAAAALTGVVRSTPRGAERLTYIRHLGSMIAGDIGAEGAELLIRIGQQALRATDEA